MHNPNDILGWVLFGGLIIGVVLGFVGIYFGMATWLAPRLKKIGTGQSPKRHTRQYCCPAGLGCNDPDTTWQKCRRQQARDMADTDEFVKLDSTWSAFVGAPAGRKSGKLAEYEATRDGIITRALGEMANGNLARKQLLAGTPEEISGEITEDDSSVSNGKSARRVKADY